MMRCFHRTPLMYLVLLAMVLCVVTAFSSHYPATKTTFRRTNKASAVVAQTTRTSSSSSSRRTRVVLRNNDDDSNSSSEKRNNRLDGMELTSALARMDQNWQIQQQRAPAQSRWTKLVLPREQQDGTSSADILEDPPLTQQYVSEDDVVYLLEPSKSFSSTPSCLIVFVGGAGLGQFPQIAYSEFLKRLSDKLNAAILTAPYTVGLDHFEIAKQTGDRLRRAILYCQDDPKRQYPDSLPIFALSHSLGCKLQTIYVAATAQDYRGMGFISYNNFSFGQTIQMARSFAEQLRGNYYAGTTTSSTKETMDKSEDAFNMIFGMAETLLGAIGLDFSPSSKDTERLIQLKFHNDLQRKTRLFVLDQDDLDTSEQFVQSCVVNVNDYGPGGPSTSGLPGTHLTPVYFKLGLDELPEETRGMARDLAGGFESASFGDEGHLNELVEEVSKWILGKEPSRPAHWKARQAAAAPARLTGVDQE